MKYATGLWKVAALYESLLVEMRRNELDVARVIKLYKELHFSVYRASGMPILPGLIERLRLRVGSVRY